MKVTAGGKDTVGDMQRVVQSIPSSYTVWKDGTQAIAECNVKGGTDYTTGTDTEVINNAMAALTNIGFLCFRKGDYAGASITLGQYISAFIERGVTNLTVAYHTSWCGTVVDCPYDSIILGRNGEVFSLHSGGNANYLHLRNAETTQCTGLRIIPNGAPATNRAYLQIFNTDFEADNTNYECAEFSFESNIAFLNVFQGGTGTLRELWIMSNADPTIKISYDVTTSSVRHSYKINYKASDPSTSDVPDGWWGLWKNTGDGHVHLWYNNGGALISATLS
jgi:hypothetical protein